MRYIVAIAVLATARVASAQIAVSPVTLTLTPEASSSLVALTNTGSEALRFQVAGYTWGQAANGEMELAPTTDITFYPAIFEVASGATKRVRVGSVVPITQGEKSYRIFIEQLPRFDGQQIGVQMLTRLSIPVFATLKPTPALPVIASQSAEKDSVSFALTNNGDSHFRVKKVDVRARDARGEVIAETSEIGWYVLGHGLRSYTIPISTCGTASIEVAVDAEPAAARTVIPVASNCGP